MASKNNIQKQIPHFVISLDFELMWGVCNSKTISNYEKNIQGVWEVIPRILELFNHFGIRATWATVGMVMCKNYSQWNTFRPSVLPGYTNNAYSYSELAKSYPDLFFARSLVDKIINVPGQEIASHTYSHFYCDEKGATPEQFLADLVCGKEIASEMGIKLKSIVLPRNQIRDKFISELSKVGLQCYRGNVNNWLYRTSGRFLLPLRIIRFIDSWMPIAGIHSGLTSWNGQILNIPASIFLRSWSYKFSTFELQKLYRLKMEMTFAARTNRICHIWFHPHNFGTNIDKNLAFLEQLLIHYCYLKDKYGMVSSSMGDFLLSEK